MFIPSQTPDLHQPLTQLLETKPVVPVTAVPGIPEDAQHLDSRVALQWAQPVLPGEKGHSARTPLAVPLAVQIVKSLNIKGFEPHGPDPDALLKGEVHPMLEEGLASWINSVVSKSVPNFRTNIEPLHSALLKSFISEPSNHSSEFENAAPISKPAFVALANASELETAELAPQTMSTLQRKESHVLTVLLSLYESLARSDIFAAQRLAESWLPRRVKPNLETHDSELRIKTNLQEEKSFVQDPQAARIDVNKVQDKFIELAQSAMDASTVQLAKWVSALEPDSEPAQLAAQMLTHGQMVWLADLAPGVPLRMVREDAWRNDANRPAQLEKGAMLSVELNLPNLGRILVSGSQWGQQVSLQIAHEANSQDPWVALTPSLLLDLKSQGIEDVRIETLPDVGEVPND
jgi:hypothetical protein